MPRLKDILRGRDLYSAAPHESVAEVAARMASLNVGAVPVLEGDQLCGIFSERDLMKRVVLAGLDMGNTPIGRVMSTSLTTAEETTTIEEGLELMHRCGCRHLPVLRDGGVVGFVSMRDLMLFELERKTDELKHMRSYIQSS
jgi:CBS domain-containing protein